MSALDVKERLSQVTDKIAVLDALKIAHEAGNPLTENVVMLGALATLEAFPVPEKDLRESISTNVPKKAVEVNLKAFDLGRKAAYDLLCNMVKCRK
jgi:indolepyruvate ferredoxin oxidoreductase beta subunit